MMTVTLVSLTEGANRSSAAGQLARLDRAMDAELDLARHQAAMIASGKSGRFAGDAAAEQHVPDFLSRAQSAWHFYNIETLYVLGPGNVVLFGSEGGAPAGDAGFRLVLPLVERLLASIERNRLRQGEHPAQPLPSPAYERRLGAAALVHDGTGLAVAAAVPIRRDRVQFGGARALIAVRPLSDDALRELGRRYGLADLSFRARTSGMPAFALPVSNAAGEPIGYLSWQVERPGSQLLPDILLLVFFGILALALAFWVLFDRLRKLGAQMAQEEEHANRLASHDHLSGVLNRRSFNERLGSELERCRRNHGGFALHLIDLDRFKEVNDTLGHHAGDEVIRETARRISDAVRGADVVARLGGDEFGIIQVDTETTLEAGALASRLREILGRPIHIKGAEISIGCSIGIALAPHEDYDLEGLMMLADSALYEAKNDGRGRHRFFEKSTDASMKMKQLVEEELRDAIASDQLELHYQPQVSADGQRMVGVEALVRWRHPVRGLIPPLDFIGLAEQRGLIVPLNNWVLRRACEDGLRWGGLKVAVNVSAVQFKQPGFAKTLSAIVAETGFDHTRLELELTESMIVEDEDKAEAAISELRDLGISLALDDFGTGYSSLIYLRRFSFDKIKIDRSFLEAMETTGESAILIHSVVHLGRALGLTVCAEGIETVEQHRFLQAAGCHELQGYLFSKPVPAARIDDLLALAAPFAAEVEAA